MFHLHLKNFLSMYNSYYHNIKLRIIVIGIEYIVLYYQNGVGQIQRWMI